MLLGDAAVENIAIGGPYAGAGAGDTPSRRRILTCTPASNASRAGVRAIDPVDARAPRVSPSGDRRRRRRVADVLRGRPPRRPRRRLRGRHPARARAAAGGSRSSCSGSSTIRPVRAAARCIASATSSSRRGCRSSCGAASRTTSCSIWRAGSGSASRASSNSRCGACSTTRAGGARSSRTSPASGSSCATSASTRPIPTSSTSSTRTCATRCGARPSCSSTASCSADRSVVDLLTADYTFVNERLARHYGIPGVYGERFRRVSLGAAQDHRRGLLGQASLLTVTSYPNRTSPVLRGKWVLGNFLGAPPPPPPPDVNTTLKDKDESGRFVSVRARLEEHRRNPACSSCHAPMDPLGFALENFDPMGRWRTTAEGDSAIDASGALVDGSRFEGPAGLRSILLARRRAIHYDGDRKASELCSRPAARSLRSAGGAQDRARRGGRRLPVVLPRSWHRRQRAVSDEEIGTHDHHEDVAVPPGNAARRRCGGRAAVPGQHDPRLRRRAGRSGHGGSPPGRGLRAERDDDAVLDAGDRGRRVRVQADPQAARAVPRSPARHLRPQRRRQHRRACRRFHAVPDRCRGQALRFGAGRRRVDGSVRRQGTRAAHAVRLAGAGARGTRLRGIVRHRVQLRLYEHDRVAQRHDAAADGKRSARGVRAAVRRRRDDRRARARGTAARRSQHPRLGAGQDDEPAAAARHATTDRSCRTTWKRSATSNGGSSWPKSRAQRTWRCRSSRSRPACRRATTSMRS